MKPKFYTHFSKLASIVLLISFTFLQKSMAQVVSTTTGGQWTTPSTWVGGIVPSGADNIEIAVGAIVTTNTTITIDGTLTIKGTLTNTGTLQGAGIKTVASGGVLNNNSGSLSGAGNYILASGSTLNIDGGTLGNAATISNHGTVNWLNNEFNQDCGQPGFLVNETDGVFNINTTSQRHMSDVNFTNNGTINKSHNSPTTFNNQCSGGSFTNSSTGVINLTNGTISFNNITSLAGTVTANGTINLNTPVTFASGINLTGTGPLNNNNVLTIPFDYTFQILTINNTNTITGAGKKTYGNGVTLNNSNTLSGVEHAIASGAILNWPSGVLGNATILSNHGTINWTDNEFNQDCGQPATLINEADGVFNINTTSQRYMSDVNFTNNGTINKSHNSPTTFNNQCSGGSFTNSSTGVINLDAGEIISFNNTTTLGGSIISSGTININGTTSLTGSLTNNGTLFVQSNITTVQSGATLAGNGIINVNGTLNLASDYTFLGNTINIIGGSIGGAGIKTYPAGLTINSTGGNYQQQ